MIDKRLNIVWAVRRKDKHNRFRLTSGLREIDEDCQTNLF